MTRPAPLNIRPVTLTGRLVQLEPLSLDHVDGLCEQGLEPALWRWIPSSVSTPAEMRDYVEAALTEQARGQALPFVIRELGSGRIVGNTRFGNISAADRRLEIGWTWVAASHQRTGVNTEAKTLLLTHAFETLGAHRVELKTDALNEKSRAAIARIGAVQEGIFRRHMVCASGRVRDTVYFSIIDSEWPAVKARLLAMA
ncbi:GNAT family N-acetyltransferase [Mitsuaria sp. WAJ17]|uniref:GNAT family N-acetyltransferase n=1 Tax=Mitsuaria sp. WAJ17 TaxID=2761452 RepID=UPI0015FFB5A1|nr:GNAT family protein [Mitsuaria sp. WAJ17]MBB2485368.1 GNAT family N-acetyltransferase [Mitsuaria sp. WAJ17]